MRYKKVYVEIVNFCNRSCAFCAGTRRPRRAMAPAEFREVAEKVSAVTDFIYLHLMGEPLLHPKLGELLDIAKELHLGVGITTNGTLLGARRELLLGESHPRKLAISLHALTGEPAPVIDEIVGFAREAAGRGIGVTLRAWDGGAARTAGEIAAQQRLQMRLEAAFGQPLGDFFAAGPARLPLGPKLHLQRADRFHWPAEATAREPRAEITPAQGCPDTAGTGTDAASAQIRPSEPLREPETSPPSIRPRALAAGGYPTLRAELKRWGAAPVCRAHTERFCLALRDQFGVLCDGTVVPCCLDSEGQMALGNLFSQPLEEILGSERARAIYDGFTARRAVMEPCFHCDFTDRLRRQ